MPTPTNLANLNLAAALSFAPLARTWYSDEFRRLGAIAHFDPSLGATDDGTTSTWVDQIGGHTVASTSQATRLIYSGSVAGLNSRPGWTGSLGNLTKLVGAQTLAELLDGSAAYSIYQVRKASSVAAGQVSLSLGSTTLSQYMYEGDAVTTGVSTVVRRNAGTDIATSLVQTGTTAKLSVVTFSGSAQQTCTNGSVTSAASTMQPTCNRFVVGALLNNGAYQFQYSGDIGDIVIFPTAHTDAERMVVERLLAQKYGWPCIRGVKGFTTSNYLANAGLTSGIRGDNTAGVWSDVLIRPDAIPTGTQYLESAWAGVAGQSIVSSGTALGFTAGNATANATSPTRTISAADIGKLMIFGGAAGPANLARGFVNGAEISAGTALTGYAKDTATAFSAGARAAVSPATNYSIFGIAGGDAAQVAANHAARAAAIKAAGRFVFNAGVAATHGWRFETPGAYHADEVGVDMLTRTGTLTETHILITSWPW